MASFAEAATSATEDESVIIEELCSRLVPIVAETQCIKPADYDGDDDEVSESITYNLSDTTILRFLRGRKGDKEKAYRALVRHLEWRKSFNIDYINIDMILDEIATGKILTTGYDVHGRPLITICASKHNMNDRDLNVMQYFIIHVLEKALKKTKPEEEKLVILFDLSNFTLQCMDYDVVKMLVSILSYNYPETLANALIVNHPLLFSACWAIIKIWLDPVTEKKVKFIRNSAELSEYIPLENVPSQVQLS